KPKFVLYFQAMLLAIVVFTSRYCSAASIACGQTVTGTTTTASQVDQYTFSGTAGQVISAALWAGFGSVTHSEVADIYSPGGQLLTTASAGDYAGSVGGGAVNLTLTNSGTFTILVHDSIYVTATSYALSLQSVNNG